MYHLTLQDGALSIRWADEASIMYERATGGLLKNNLLMHFAHADFEEVCVCVWGLLCLIVHVRPSSFPYVYKITRTIYITSPSAVARQEGGWLKYIYMYQ